MDLSLWSLSSQVKDFLSDSYKEECSGKRRAHIRGIIYGLTNAYFLFSCEFNLSFDINPPLHCLMFKTHSDAIVYYVGAWMMLNIADSDLTATVIMKVAQKAFWNRKYCFTAGIITQVAVLVLNGGAMIGISVTALMDINVMLVQVNISVFVQFPNISVSLKRPTWLKTMEQIFRPSESLRWLTGSQRSTATPLLDWSWTPSRATSTCREPDSPTPPGDQVAAGLKIRFIICPHPRPNVSILRSLGLNIQPGEKVTICHFFTFYSNITVQRTPFLFRMYDLWVRGSCSEILMFTTMKASHRDILVSNLSRLQSKMDMIWYDLYIFRLHLSVSLGAENQQWSNSSRFVIDHFIADMQPG